MENQPFLVECINKPLAMSARKRDCLPKDVDVTNEKVQMSSEIQTDSTEKKE